MLVGDDFRFGARRAGDYAMLDAAGSAAGFDVARMISYEVHGLRVSSSAVREALAAGDMAQAAALLGRPVQHQRPRGARPQARARSARAPGRGDGFRTLNLRFAHPQPAAHGIFVGAGARPGATRRCPASPAWACGPTVDDSGRVLLEVHCLRLAGRARRRGGLR